jgi:hypothetical protein
LLLPLVEGSLAGPFCISKKTGVVRKVAPKVKCHKREIRKVGFAVKGLHGPAGAAGPQEPNLSAREVSVLKLVAEGGGNARRIDITISIGRGRPPA